MPAEHANSRFPQRHPLGTVICQRDRTRILQKGLGSRRLTNRRATRSTSRSPIGMRVTAAPPDTAPARAARGPSHHVAWRTTDATRSRKGRRGSAHAGCTSRHPGPAILHVDLLPRAGRVLSKSRPIRQASRSTRRRRAWHLARPAPCTRTTARHRAGVPNSNCRARKPVAEASLRTSTPGSRPDRRRPLDRARRR